MHVPVPGTSSRTTGEHEAGHLALTTLEQAMAAYVQEMRACGRNPKTLQWHQTSLGALQRYLWRQFRLTDVCSLTTESLRTWLTDLSIAPSARTGATRTVNTVAAYARSARACQLPGEHGGHNAGMTARNRAILWLLLDTGLQVSELCRLRLADVDRAGGTVMVCGKGGRPRTFSLSTDPDRALRAAA